MRVFANGITSPEELRRELARRRREVGLPQLLFDRVAGLADGHTGKLECGTKTFGRMSLPTVLSALGLRLALVEAPEGVPATVLSAAAEQGPSAGRAA
jgi:hypothetical protein